MSTADFKANLDLKYNTYIEDINEKEEIKY
jgi:hypothetical protein